ncbi:MAG: pentapeptide repeat-containing protein, partial [Methanotrichaceae archaeon]
MVDSSLETTKLTKVPASEILAKIKTSEPIKLDNVIIMGNLDIVELGIKFGEKFSTASTIKITNSLIEGAINFSNTEFKNDDDEEVDFSKTTFGNKVNFSMAQFQQGVNFQEAHFTHEVNFKGAKLFSATFVDARLDGYGNFKETEFYEFTAFDAMQFNNYANFVKSSFTPVASFHWAVFNDNANFSGAKFCERANFASARFYIDANFANANFDRTINLKDAMFTRMDISWESIKNSLEYNDAVYLGLAKNYNNIGLFSDADSCYYQYRTLRRKNHLNGFEYLLDLIAWIPYG